MANDGTLDSHFFKLIDNWDGPIISDRPPEGGFASPLEHNVEWPAHRLGSKIQVLNHSSIAGEDGLSMFIYLKGLGHTVANPTIAAKQFVSIAAISEPYRVTNDKERTLGDTVATTGCPFVAVAIGLMAFTESVTRYGWFWCGGVVPEEYIRIFGGNWPTKDGGVAIGPVICDALSTDAMGLAPVDADTSAIIGYSYSADS